MKQCLFEEHWTLIFDNLRKVDKQRLISGDFNSVKFSDALKRLKDICEIEFKDEHEKTLKRLKSERNKIEHYQVHISQVVAITTIVSTWSFIFEFISKNILLDNTNSEQFDFIKDRMYQLEEYVNHRRDEIKPELQKLENNSIKIIRCASCGEVTLPLLDRDTSCLYCNETYEYPFKCNGGCGADVELSGDEYDLLFCFCSSCYDRIVLGIYSPWM